MVIFSGQPWDWLGENDNDGKYAQTVSVLSVFDPESK